MNRWSDRASAEQGQAETALKNEKGSRGWSLLHDPGEDVCSGLSPAHDGPFQQESIVVDVGLEVLRPGRVSYAAGLALQERLVAERRRGAAPDTLVLLEHDAVVTLGRGADPSHVLLDRERLARKGIELFETGRGGDVTLHSPGQVVGYPVLALQGAKRDAHLYLRDLEEVMIRVALSYGIRAGRVSALTGIWVGGDKLGAIGVRIQSGWITSHGFAFNVANDLALFDVIVPCGIRGRGVTSLSKLLGREISVSEVVDRFEVCFREVFTTPVHDAAVGVNFGLNDPFGEPQGRGHKWGGVDHPRFDDVAGGSGLPPLGDPSPSATALGSSSALPVAQGSSQGDVVP